MSLNKQRVIVTLLNGKKVANFSSPHPFTFTDGTVLPAVSPEMATKLSVVFEEHTLNELGDVQLTFRMTDDLYDEIHYWMFQYNLGEVDVVFCPLPMITALHEVKFDVRNSPFRAVRMEDRISKLVSTTKQCV